MRTHRTDIDVADTAFRLSFGRPLEPLAEAIRQTGYLQPIVLQERRPRRVICGFRRLEATTGDVEAVVLPIDDRAALRLSYLENVTSRGLNEFEKALVLAKMPEEDRERTARELGIPAGRQAIQAYIGFCALEEGIRLGLAQGSVHPQTGFTLLKLMPEDRMAAWDRVLRPLAPTVNDAREILLWLQELAAIKKCAYADLLKTSEPLADLKARLRDLRFPLMQGQKRRFEGLVGSSGLPRDIRLEPPKNFEGTHLEVAFQAQSDADLLKKLEALQEAVRAGHTGTILALLQGKGR